VERNEQVMCRRLFGSISLGACILLALQECNEDAVVLAATFDALLAAACAPESYNVLLTAGWMALVPRASECAALGLAPGAPLPPAESSTMSESAAAAGDQGPSPATVQLAIKCVRSPSIARL
jgi:hypothetical protein